MDRSYNERNAGSRQRLREITERLDDAALALPLGDGWTIAAALAHLAFWDEWSRVRWDIYERDGAIEPMPEAVIELANAAALPAWLALPPRQAVELVLAAAEAGDRCIAELSDRSIGFAQSTGRRIMLDRTLHRDPHLDEIERALKGT